RFGRAASFSLGFSVDRRGAFQRPQRPTEAYATYANRLGQPELSALRTRASDSSADLTLSQEASTRHVRLEVRFDNKTRTVQFDMERTTGPTSADEIAGAARSRFYEGESSRGAKERRAATDLWYRTYRMLAPEPPMRALSIAPIRTRPRRTYDEATEEFTSEGEHVPFVLLNRLVNDNGSELPEALEEYGKESGLFRQIHV